jgi:hypothetical protein
MVEGEMLLHHPIDENENRYVGSEEAHRAVWHRTVNVKHLTCDSPPIGNIKLEAFKRFYDFVSYDAATFVGVPLVDDRVLCSVGRPHLFVIGEDRVVPVRVTIWIEPAYTPSADLRRYQDNRLRNPDQPAFYILSAAQGLSQIITTYDVARGHVTHVMDDMGAPLLFLAVQGFKGTLHWQTSNTFYVEADQKYHELKAEGTQNITTFVEGIEPSPSDEDMELVNRVTFKHKHNIKCKVTYPDSLDIPKYWRPLPNKRGPVLEKADIAEFDKVIRRFNFDFQVVADENGINNGAPSFDMHFKAAQLKAPTQETIDALLKPQAKYPGAAAVLLDHYPLLTYKKFADFLRCNRIMKQFTPTPYNILAQYSHHTPGQLCTSVKPYTAHEDSPKSIMEFIAMRKLDVIPENHQLNASLKALKRFTDEAKSNSITIESASSSASDSPSVPAYVPPCRRSYASVIRSPPAAKTPPEASQPDKDEIDVILEVPSCRPSGCIQCQKAGRCLRLQGCSPCKEAYADAYKRAGLYKPKSRESTPGDKDQDPDACLPFGCFYCQRWGNDPRHDGCLKCNHHRRAVRHMHSPDAPVRRYMFNGVSSRPLFSDESLRKVTEADLEAAVRTLRSEIRRAQSSMHPAFRSLSDHIRQYGPSSSSANPALLRRYSRHSPTNDN